MSIKSLVGMFALAALAGVGLGAIVSIWRSPKPQPLPTQPNISVAAGEEDYRRGFSDAYGEGMTRGFAICMEGIKQHQRDLQESR